MVTLWIGGLKVTKYESEGIIPFVANSPFFKWMINHPEEYKEHKNPEGAVVATNQAWHESNGTYSVGIFIGATIVLIGLLIAAGWIRAEFSLIGGLLLAGMSLVTLSFLITTPEVWVPNLCGPDHGFPYLATPGRLVIKDAIMLGGHLYGSHQILLSKLFDDDRHSGINNTYFHRILSINFRTRTVCKNRLFLHLKGADLFLYHAR